MSLRLLSVIGPGPNNSYGNECMPANLCTPPMYNYQQRSFNFRLLLIALLSLLLGILVYITARAPGTTGFLPAGWNISLAWPRAVLSLAGSLPTFFHTLAFCLLLSLIAGARRRTTVWTCLLWLSIEIAFEVGQYPQLSHWLTEHIPSGFAHTWLLSQIGPYFITGVFDPFDLIAAMAGAILALVLVVVMVPEKRQSHE